jgi:hypothetical protein
MASEWKIPRMDRRSTPSARPGFDLFSLARQSGGGGRPTGSGQYTGGRPTGGTLQQLASGMADQYWGDDEDGALIELVRRESGWNPAAANPRSSARGLFQKMTSLHGALESTPEGQIGWGLRYIRDRYGSPTRALAFHNRNNWY